MQSMQNIASFIIDNFMTVSLVVSAFVFAVAVVMGMWYILIGPVRWPSDYTGVRACDVPMVALILMIPLLNIVAIYVVTLTAILRCMFYGITWLGCSVLFVIHKLRRLRIGQPMDYSKISDVYVKHFK